MASMTERKPLDDDKKHQPSTTLQRPPVPFSRRGSSHRRGFCSEAATRKSNDNNSYNNCDEQSSMADATTTSTSLDEADNAVAVIPPTEEQPPQPEDGGGAEGGRPRVKRQSSKKFKRQGSLRSMSSRSRRTDGEEGEKEERRARSRSRSRMGRRASQFTTASADSSDHGGTDTISGGSHHRAKSSPRERHDGKKSSSSSSSSHHHHHGLDDNSSTASSQKENKSSAMSSVKMEKLETQNALYKEQYKLIAKEKKQIQAKLAEETAAKNKRIEELEQELLTVKMENGILKAEVQNGGGSGRPNNNSNNGEEKETDSELYTNTKLLLTGVPRPQPSLFQLPGLRSMPFWTQSLGGGDHQQQTKVAYQDPSLSWAVQHFEDNYDAIVDEYQRVAPFLPTDMPPADHPSASFVPAHDGTWSWHSHTLQGKTQDRFLHSFPKTSEILQFVAQKGLLFSHIPFAHSYFSTLHANSFIGSHTSPVNLRVRLYLPLLTAETEDENTGQTQRPSGLRVGTTNKAWLPGRAILIDDSYEHEEWNESETADAAVLIVDLWHPDVSIQERKELIALFDNTLQEDWMRV